MSTIVEQDAVADIRLAPAVLAEKIDNLAGSLSQRATGPTAASVVRLEVKVPDTAVLSWLAAQESTQKVYWSGRDGDFETAALGIADLVEGDRLSEPDSFFRRLRRFLPVDSNDVRYYGGLRFSEETGPVADNLWRRFGAYRFVLPRFELVKQAGETRLACNVVPGKDRDNLNVIRAQLENITFIAGGVEWQAPSLRKRVDTPDRTEWNAMVRTVLRSIADGKLSKAVLARRTTFEFSQPLRPLLLLDRLKACASDCFHFCFQLGGGEADNADDSLAFLGASPELLYRRQGRAIQAEALAGTRPRGRSDTEDTQLGNELLSSEKEMIEHRYVAETVGNAIGRFCLPSDAGCDNASVALLKLARVQHLVTRFEGKLDHAVTDADLLSALHPTPAVGGYPTPAAIELIGRLEMFDRGWYAGLVGWVGPDAAEFAVGIRSGLVHGRRLHFYSGAGIVNGSTPDGEWDEIENKLASFAGTFEQP